MDALFHHENWCLLTKYANPLKQVKVPLCKTTLMQNLDGRRVTKFISPLLWNSLTYLHDESLRIWI